MKKNALYIHGFMGNPEKCNIQNSILINGHHSIEEEYLTEGLHQAEQYFEGRAQTDATVEMIY